MKYLLFTITILLSTHAHAFSGALDYQECKVLKNVWAEKTEGKINFKYFLRTPDRIYSFDLKEMSKHITNEQSQIDYMAWAIAHQKDLPDPCEYVR